MTLAIAFQQAAGLLAMESEPADGKLRTEREFTYYAKIVDPSELERADSKEDQEQWSMRVSPQDHLTYAGETRMRRIVREGEEPKYILTAKTFKVGDFGKDEVETEASEAMFNLYKRLSNSGMIKRRHCFNRPDGLVWEVDVYYTPDGQMVPWVKVDLEVKDEREAPQDFPIQLTDVIEGDVRKRSDAERQQVAEILDKHFVLKNQYPKAAA